jgi:hypothetical protein
MTIKFLITLDPALMDLVRSIASAISAGSNPNPQLDRIEGAITLMRAELLALQQQVQRDTEITSSAVTLLNGLAQQIREFKDDPVALAGLADSLEANNKALADAVAANTPAAPTPTE